MHSPVLCHRYWMVLTKLNVFVICFLCLLGFLKPTPVYAQIPQGYVSLDARTYLIIEDWEARGLIPTMPLTAPYRLSDIYEALLIIKAKDSLLTATDKYWIPILEQRIMPKHWGKTVGKKKVPYNLNWDNGLTLFDKFKNSYNILPVFDNLGGVENNLLMEAHQRGLEIDFQFFNKMSIQFRYMNDWMGGGKSYIPNYNLWRNFSPYYGLIDNISQGIMVDTPSLYTFKNMIFTLGFDFDWVSFSLGKNSYRVGEGESGNTILSDKATPFLNVRLDIKPSPIFHFTYFHGVLSSLERSGRTYPTSDTAVLSRLTEFRSKYIVFHSLTLQPWKNVQFSIGENVIYSDKFQFLYLIPFTPFRLFLNDELSTVGFNTIDNPNTQVFATLSVKNLIPRSSIYAEIMVDEILPFEPKDKRRDQLAYLLGLRLHNYLIPQSVFTLEYTHLNPFIYKNINPAQTFENAGMVMGHWLRDDADLIYVSFKKQFGWQWDINTWAKHARKGYSGTTQEQYDQGFVSPFDFLQKGVKHYYTEAGVSVYYHWKHTMHLYAEYLYKNISGLESINEVHILRLGFRIGRL